MRKILLQCSVLICRYWRNPTCIIQFHDGVSRKVHGHAKQRFIIDCLEIAETYQLASGFIYVVEGQYGSKVVKGSMEVKADVLQQFRNAWGF
jgi:hypothetical protein